MQASCLLPLLQSLLRASDIDVEAAPILYMYGMHTCASCTCSMTDTCACDVNDRHAYGVIEAMAKHPQLMAMLAHSDAGGSGLSVSQLLQHHAAAVVEESEEDDDAGEQAKE